ncbi:MAG: PD-(D/E)XK motif protein, partial [Crenarchaeota archaeon]|nr:PD-(D/E)XK motif protein [Thermoproteota archaeon]
MLISSVWENLENQPKGTLGGYLLQRILPDSNHCLYLALEKQSGARVLMMQVSQLSAAKITELPKSKGFDVKKVRLEDAEKDKITIQVILNDKRYSDIFSRLIQDIVDNIAKIQREDKAVQDLIMRLQRWQFFLSRNNPEGLSSEEQQGLFGELWFFKSFLIQHLNPKKAVTSWKGSTGTVQDFYFKECVIEVKTTTTKAHQKLFISNEKQLDNEGLDTLILLHLPLEERPEAGET